MVTWRTNRRTKKRYGRITGVGGRRQDEFLAARDTFADEFVKSQNAWAEYLARRPGEKTRSREHKALQLKQGQERSALAKKHRQAGSKKHGKRRNNEGPFVPEF